MKLWDRLVKGRKLKKEDPLEEAEDWGEVVLDRKSIDFNDAGQREKYVRGCLEQMMDASNEMDQLSHEYNLVTSYLTDMEELDALPVEERAEITKCAMDITELEGNGNIFQRVSRMTDFQYHQMERLEDVMPEGYHKLKECEDYQVLVKRDLVRLDGERHAYYFRRDELESMIENARGITFICIGSVIAACVLMFVLQEVLGLETQIGYLLSIAAGAVAMTVVFLRHSDAMREYKKLEISINKIILLQNRVKIRYVNNTHLLEYLNVKYGVESSNRLKFLWDQFLVEREERARIKEAREELDVYYSSLIRKLRKYRIKDPNIWIHQAAALVDSKEMVEIRHGLITRRQKLRKQMEYNKEMAEKAHKEIRDLVDLYPDYASQMLSLVSEYEKMKR